jgi:hypothetical protein
MKSFAHSSDGNFAKTTPLKFNSSQEIEKLSHQNADDNVSTGMRSLETAFSCYTTPALTPVLF